MSDPRRAASAELMHIGRDDGDLRFFIRLGGEHAGGITVHSVSGDSFAYGIAVAPAMRRRGVASQALLQLFALMKARGFSRVLVRVEPGNAASLALHRRLGFERVGERGGAILLERAL